MVAATISPPLTLERARELLTLDTSTGHLFWTALASMGRRKGQRAGSHHKAGYRQIKIDGVFYLEHRVVWLLAHGAWPELPIDHIDGDRANNRPVNLRLATTTQNAQNQRRAPTSNKSSGLLGVVWEKGTPGRRRGRWCAQIRVDGVLHRLGRFDDKDEAHAAYLSAKRRLHGHCTI